MPCLRCHGFEVEVRWRQPETLAFEMKNLHGKRKISFAGSVSSDEEAAAVFFLLKWTFGLKPVCNADMENWPPQSRGCAWYV